MLVNLLRGNLHLNTSALLNLTANFVFSTSTLLLFRH